MGDSLEVLFDGGLPAGKKSLKFLKKAYDCGAQTLVNRSLTDKLLQNSGLSFHIGTDDPTMRRIASWLLTNHHEFCESLIPMLWKRKGREDVKLIGLLIANIEGDAWGKLLNVIDTPIPLDLTLEVMEEIKRSGRDVPTSDYLAQWKRDSIQMQNVMLIASLEMRGDLIEIVKNAPEGGDLFERIRSRSLNQ